MIRASIDLGTNTCLLLVADWDPLRKQVIRTLKDEARVVRLGEGVDQHRLLQPRPQERTLQCLKEYSQQIIEAGVPIDQVICVATSQARDAKNSSEFFQNIQKATGLRFRVISGEDEAKYTFIGALLPGMDSKSTAVIDIGGGSTEITSAQGGISVDLGSVRFTERFFKSDPVRDEEFWACQEEIDLKLQPFLSWRKNFDAGGSLLAVAGTATTLAAWYLNLARFEPAKVDEVTLTRGDLHRMVEELKWRTTQERALLPCMEPLRADVILAGAMILWRTLEVLNFAECRVSTRGLRYGLFQNE